MPGSHLELEGQLLGLMGDLVAVGLVRGCAEPPGQCPPAQGCQCWVGLERSRSFLRGGCPGLNCTPALGRAQLHVLSHLTSPMPSA